MFLAENEGFTLKIMREAFLIPRTLCLVIFHIPISIDVVDLLLIVLFHFSHRSNLLGILNMLSHSFLHDEDLPLFIFKQLINLSR